MAWFLDENERRVLEAAGWPADLLDSLRQKDGTKKIDRMFLESTRRLLAAAGYSALEFLDANPGLSENEMADVLRQGASGFGLLMAIYEEAEQRGCVREVAKDLLVRKIIERFPAGWMSGDEVGPAVKLGGWDHSIRSYVSDRRCWKSAAAIMRHITVEFPPPNGWTPQLKDDPLIDELFRRYWAEDGHDKVGAL